MVETSREFDARWPVWPTDRDQDERRERNRLAEAILREKLRPGDKLRAKAARCAAHEATFTFDRWEGRWIISKSGIEIAPRAVYSVNEEVIRL